MLDPTCKIVQPPCMSQIDLNLTSSLKGSNKEVVANSSTIKQDQFHEKMGWF